ncbi:hypothetical protein SKAU_G00335580 [Synaphobranchus kaupii]|uniref:Uncharacterized protein n=1 Tax=Synaphobranchus kaupii TaxID=118154 RepID=A0A9Q1IIN7_SYNKA|nr:hypothetical protein SKAU_G00335580 [Synaphobranchus kaupii]
MGWTSERSGGEGRGPHLDSGSLSPTWERDRRGPLPPPGYPYPDPGLPYRRRPLGSFPMGPGYRPEDPVHRTPTVSAPTSQGKSGENENRDSILSLSGELRVPPEADALEDLQWACEDRLHQECFPVFPLRHPSLWGTLLQGSHLTVSQAPPQGPPHQAANNLQSIPQSPKMSSELPTACHFLFVLKVSCRGSPRS